MKNFFTKIWKTIKESKLFRTLLIIFSITGSVILLFFKLNNFKFTSPKEKEFDKKVKKAKEKNDDLNKQIDSNKKESKKLNNKIDKDIKTNQDKKSKRKKRQKETDNNMKKYIKD